jgi:hypothetical protein
VRRGWWHATDGCGGGFVVSIFRVVVRSVLENQPAFMGDSVTISRESMQTLRDALQHSFPNATADPPKVPLEHVVSNGTTDLGVIENGSGQLLVRQDCFENNTIDTIAGALHQLNYGERLTAGRPVALGHSTGNAVADTLATWGDWYLFAG